MANASLHRETFGSPLRLGVEEPGTEDVKNRTESAGDAGRAAAASPSRRAPGRALSRRARGGCRRASGAGGRRPGARAHGARPPGSGPVHVPLRLGLPGAGPRLGALPALRRVAGLVAPAPG